MGWRASLRHCQSHNRKGALHEQEPACRGDRRRQRSLQGGCWACGRVVLDHVGKTLKKGDEVVITGFGKFSVVKRAARQGVNPRTGEKVKIKASKAPKFTPGASLKQTVHPKK